MILGHWACASLARRTIFRTEGLAWLVVAAYGPDLLDKTLNVLLATPGRAYGHSLLVFIGLAGLAWLAWPVLGLDRRRLWPGLVMWLAHLAGDFVAGKVLLWPFLGDFGPDVRFAFLESFYNMYVAWLWPAALGLEIACLTAAAAVWLIQSSTRRHRLAARLPQRPA